VTAGAAITRDRAAIISGLAITARTTGTTAAIQDPGRTTSAAGATTAARQVGGVRIEA
jgi:hypothetical protein